MEYTRLHVKPNSVPLDTMTQFTGEGIQAERGAVTM